MDFRENFYEDEVRTGFYVPSLMKRNWVSELEILGEIDKICKKYGLQWFMCFGTLRGAVRHKGFIPWDDDIDIDDERCSLDVANMRHYVTVPGCVSADLILLQTENLRKSYIRVLTEFCGEDTKERWERCVKVMTPFLS